LHLLTVKKDLQKRLAYLITDFSRKGFNIKNYNNYINETFCRDADHYAGDVEIKKK